MKTKLFLLLGIVLLIGSQPSFSQGTQGGMPNQYKRIIFCDNLSIENIPKLLKSYYDSESKNHPLQWTKVIVDTLARTRNLMTFSRGAQDGYLQVNKEATAYMKDKQMGTESLKIEYEVDGIPVSTRKSVKTLISLTAEQLKSVEFVDPSPDNGNTLTVRITTLNRQ